MSEPSAEVVTQRDRAKALYLTVRDAHTYVKRVIDMIRETSLELTLADGDGVDCSYMLREAAVFADDIKKECRALKQLMDTTLCRRQLGSPTMGDVLHGEYASGTPDCGFEYLIPSLETDPVGYNKLMDYLGIPVEVRDQGKVLTDAGEFSTACVQPHWPGIQFLIRRLMLHGHPEPQGLSVDKKFPVYGLNIRRKRAIPDANS